MPPPTTPHFFISYGIGDPLDPEWINSPLNLNVGDDLIIRIEHGSTYDPVPDSVSISINGDGGSLGSLGGDTSTLITDNSFVHTLTALNLLGVQRLAGSFHAQVTVTVDGVDTQYDTDNSIECTSNSESWDDAPPGSVTLAGFTLTALGAVSGGISFSIAADDTEAIFKASASVEMVVLYGISGRSDLSASVDAIGVCTMFDTDGVYQGPQTFTLLDTLTDPAEVASGSGNYAIRVAIPKADAKWYKSASLISTVSVPGSSGGFVMPVIPKKTVTENKVPTTDDIALGELALDLVSGKMYARLLGDVIQQLNTPTDAPADGIAFTPTVFVGDGVTASFPVSGTITSDPNKVIATASGLVQRPSIDFTISGGVLTPTTVPLDTVVWLVLAIPRAASVSNAVAKALIFG